MIQRMFCPWQAGHACGDPPTHSAGWAGHLGPSLHSTLGVRVVPDTQAPGDKRWVGMGGKARQGLRSRGSSSGVVLSWGQGDGGTPGWHGPQGKQPTPMGHCGPPRCGRPGRWGQEHQGPRQPWAPSTAGQDGSAHCPPRAPCLLRAVEAKGATSHQRVSVGGLSS